MATEIAVQKINGPFEPSSNTTPLSTLTWTAADPAGNTIVMPNKKVLVLFRNSGASTRTIAATSSYLYGRTADIPPTNLAAGALYGRFFEPRGWEGTLGAGDLNVVCNHAEVLIAAIQVEE